ncbi:cytochrome P450 [Annulohypoxylon bovei var. microspora]|nr:cytochrome P450 [Annulohypoxylon bovei var. microspora]
MILLLWRVWRFTITPFLYPDDPKELPYWVPFLGHLRPFFQDSNALLSRAKLYFGNTKEPFALTIAGSTTYVIARAQDVAEAYKNNSTLSWTEFLLEMMRTLGNDELCVEAVANPLPRDKDGFPNPNGKPLLHPGNQLDDLERRFLRWFERHLEPDMMVETYGSSVAHKDKDVAVTVPLVQWCSEFFTLASQEAYFGPELAHIDPHLHETFIVFDELSYQILYQYPRLLAGKMRAAKAQLQHAMKAYLRLPRSKRTGNAWFTDAFETECKALGIDENQIAIMFFTVYWGANTNTRKAAYWLLAHLLGTPGLLATLRAETDVAFDESGHLDPARLHDAQHNQCFEAVWNETIRMSAYASSVRFITRDTIIGGKVLRQGRRLMIPYRQLHFDEDVFGPGINEFRPARFGFDVTATGRKENKENGAHQNLTRGDSWRPFGGGVTMCPGRYIAKRSIHIFIALLLHRYDVESVGPRTVPEAEMGKPVLGIMSVKEEAEAGEVKVKVKLTSRNSKYR